jgi:hypothetical protein|tara:strand:+ start:273 stop:2036 length:1764 start_codon:yes stop_codon:yes gene_type:complete
MARFTFPFFGKSKTLEEKVNDILTKRNRKIEQLAYAQTADATTKSNSISNILKALKSKVLSVIAGGNRGIFITPEWDFKKVQLAFTNESIFRRSVEKYVEQIRKHSWEFIGNNPTTVEYIRKRFNQIAIVTNKPTAELFDEITFNMVLYSNSIITKQRNRKASGGKERKSFDGFTRVPVAGYQPVDPSSVKVDRDNYGNIRKWKQISGQNPSKPKDPAFTQFLINKPPPGIKDPEWSPYNVIHIKDRSATPSMFFFSMPMSVPVIADMEALRELEELSLLESIKVAIPKLHAKVGSKEQPGTQEQVDDLASTIQSLTGDGVLVTSERVSVEDIAKATNANNILTSSINYFKARVLAGLGMSGVAMGEGDSANRATAQVISSEMQSTSAKFQRILKNSIEFFMITELLYESGYTEFTLNDENMVYLSIPEVDLSEKIKREAHQLNLYINNALTEEELRKELGRDIILQLEREAMYLNRVQIPLAEAKASALSEAGENLSSNVSRPTNQQGTQLSKPSVTRDYYTELWNQALGTQTVIELEDLLTGSKLDPYDITTMKIMLRRHSNGGNFKEVIGTVFDTLEAQIIKDA